MISVQDTNDKKYILPTTAIPMNIIAHVMMMRRMTMLDYSGDANNMVTDAGWTAQKPTVPGWYWFRRIDLPLHCARAAVLEVSAVKCVLGVHEDYGDGVLWHPLKEYSGEWLGPITPTDRETWRSAGRVEGLREAAEMVDDDCYMSGGELLPDFEYRCKHNVNQKELAAKIRSSANKIEQAAQGAVNGNE